MIISISKRDSIYNVFFADDRGIIVQDQCCNTESFQRFKFSEIEQMIKDKPELLDAPLPMPAPTPDEIKAAAVEKLKELDMKSIRPLRAIQQGTSTKADTDMLTDIESQVAVLRDKI